MAQLSRAQVASQVAADLANNSSGSISAQDVRDVLTNMADSAIWHDEANSGPTGPEGPQGPAGPAGTNGTNGLDGTDGTDGADGAGLPVGGTTGQIAAKASNADHDVEWVDPATATSDLADGSGRSIGGTQPFDHGYFDALTINGDPVQQGTAQTADSLWGWDQSATTTIGYTLGLGLGFNGTEIVAEIGSNVGGKAGCSQVQNVLQCSQSAYDALSAAEQNDGTFYVIV